MNFILTFFLIILMTFEVSARKWSDNTLLLGDKTTSVKEICLGQGCQNRIRVPSGGGDIEFSNDGGTSFKKIGSGGGGGGIELPIENPDFEADDPPAGWTASGGSFTASVGTGFDLQSGSIDFSSSGQTLTSTAVTVPDGLEGRACSSSIQYDWPTGTNADISMQVIEGASNVIADVSLNATSGDWVKQPIFFTCPTADTVKIRLIANVSDPTVLRLDNAKIGKLDFIQGSDVSLVAQAFYQGTASCVWSRTSATFGAFSTEANCPAINVVTSTQSVNTADNDLPDIVFDNLLGNKKYTVDVSFSGRNSVAETNTISYHITDGITVGPVCSFATPIAANGQERKNLKCTFAKDQLASGAVTFSLEGASNGAAGAVNILNGSAIDGELSWTIRSYPLSSPEAINLETIGWHIDANIGGSSNPALSTSLEADYIPINNSDIDLVVNTSKGSRPAFIACASSEVATGSTCTASEQVGISFDIQTAGRYRACVAFSHKYTMNADTTSMGTTFQIIETPNNAETLTQLGGSRIESFHQFPGARSTGRPYLLCGSFVFNSVGQKTLRLMYELDFAGTITLHELGGDRDANKGQRDIHWTVEKLDQQFPTPVFTDLTNSLSDRLKATDSVVSQLTQKSVKIDFRSGTPVIDTEFGDWIDSLADTGVGISEVTLTGGTFTGEIICTCGAEDNSSDRSCSFTSVDTTTITVNGRIDSTGSQTDDISVNVTCTASE